MPTNLVGLVEQHGQFYSVGHIEPSHNDHELGSIQ